MDIEGKYLSYDFNGSFKVPKLTGYLMGPCQFFSLTFILGGKRKGGKRLFFSSRSVCLTLSVFHDEFFTCDTSCFNLPSRCEG